MRRLLAGAAIAAAGAAHAAGPPPDLTGRWAGEGYTLTITGQVGRALEGETEGPYGLRPIYGVIQMDDRAVVFVNRWGNMHGLVLSPAVFSFCPEPRQDMKREGPCYRLERQPEPAE